MIKELKIFNNEEFGEVRVVEKNGDPWFVVGDIAGTLGFRDNYNATRGLDDDEKDTHKVSTLGGEQSVTVINESGLYSIILKSNKPEAKRFKKWVTSEVLPSIRKNGGYLAPTVDFSDPDNIQALLDAWKSDREKLKIAEKQREKDRPKVEFYEAVTGSSDTIDMKEVAKILNVDGLGRNKMFEFLRGCKILDRNNQPYQKFVDSGHFRLVESKYYVDGEARVNTKTVVYQKGLDYIRKVVDKYWGVV